MYYDRNDSKNQQETKRKTITYFKNIRIQSVITWLTFQKGWSLFDELYNTFGCQKDTGVKKQQMHNAMKLHSINL